MIKCVLMKILSHASAKRKKKRLKGFEFRTFSGRFQVAVTGLSNLQRERCFSPKSYPEASETVSTQQTEVSSSVNSSSLILSALCGRIGSVIQDTKIQHNFIIILLFMTNAENENLPFVSLEFHSNIKKDN